MVEFNPKSEEERRKDYSEREAKREEMRRKADPAVGLCFVGDFTWIANLDGIEEKVKKAKEEGVLPLEFGPGYKVSIITMSDDSVIITSKRKVKGKDWSLRVAFKNLKCYHDLSRDGTTPAPVPPIPAPTPAVPSTTPPTTAVKWAVLLISMAGKPIGTKIPVIKETQTHYRVKLPEWPQDVGFPKATENQHYRIETEAAPEIPLPPTPTAPTPEAPKPGAPVPITSAWQLVETPEAKERRNQLLEKKELLKKIPPIYDALGDHFQFHREFDRDVFTSIFFIPNSSLVLKGVPGTGKTQLIEMATLMFANDFKKPGADLNVYDETGLKVIGQATKNRRFMTQWLLDRGILGSVKHNSDKEIQDVFFFTKINIEKYTLAATSPATVPEAAAPSVPVPAVVPSQPIVTQTMASEMPAISPSVPMASSLFEDGGSEEDIFGIRKNPLPVKWWGTFNRQPEKLDVYDISPEPRPIIYSLIKFHNEANRMNANVADVLLGLMSEQEVEYQGKKFVSPIRWIEETQELDWGQSADTGSISFFDYNPHLEVDHPEMELDRALLDRITAGMYLSGGSTAMRFQVMDKKSKEIPQPREVVFKMLIDGKVQPITRAELKEIWGIVNGSKGGLVPSAISVDAETMAWIAWMTNLPNLTNKKYGGAYQGNIRAGVPIAGQPIDRTLTTFKQALETMEDIRPPTGNIAEDEQVAVNELQRPLGVRSAESLLAMLRSTTFLFRVTRRGWKPDDFVVYAKTDRERDKIFDDLCELLPYVLDHRINLGVGPALKAEFLSTFDLIKHYFVPLMKKKKPVLYSIMDALMEVYVENQKRTRSGGRSMTDTEKATKFREVLYRALSRRAPSANFDTMVKEESLIFTLVDLLSAM